MNQSKSHFHSMEHHCNYLETHAHAWIYVICTLVKLINSVKNINLSYNINWLNFKRYFAAVIVWCREKAVNDWLVFIPSLLFSSGWTIGDCRWISIQDIKSVNIKVIFNFEILSGRVDRLLHENCFFYYFRVNKTTKRTNVQTEKQQCEQYIYIYC